MPEMMVVLDFTCAECAHAMNVTVKCAGKGLACGPAGAAAVNVPCPTCGGVNQVVFEPAGKVRRVAARCGLLPWLEPSAN